MKHLEKKKGNLNRDALKSFQDPPGMKDLGRRHPLWVSFMLVSLPLSSAVCLIRTVEIKPAESSNHCKDPAYSKEIG